MDRVCPQPLLAVQRLQIRLLLALIGITLAVFGRVCGHEFVHFDDNVTIYNNPHIKGLTWENLQWMFTNVSYARRYMPLGWLSYAVDYQLFGLNPHAYHAGNLLLHLLNVVLLFFLLKWLLALGDHRFGVDSQQDRAPADGQGCPLSSQSADIWCAALGALFWGINPLRVEN